MDIELTEQEKRRITQPVELYAIMQRILLRENEIDQEKEHFWIIGMNIAGYILYIELVALGSYKSVDVEPMNVYRVAVMKNACRVIAVHNHPSHNLQASEADEDITDRLIQVGKILNIELVDHLIISPENYSSFAEIGLMAKLEKSVRYVPTYQLIEQIRKEEKKIAKERLAIAQTKTKTAQEKAKQEKELRKQAEKKAENEKGLLIKTLIAKDVSIEDIAKILEITSQQVQDILYKQKKI